MAWPLTNQISTTVTPNLVSRHHGLIIHIIIIIITDETNGALLGETFARNLLHPRDPRH